MQLHAPSYRTLEKMRIHGNLKKWNDDRGFGFIDSPKSEDEIFVHISAFPKDGKRPKVGELISFEIQTDNKGKKRAVKIQRPGNKKPQIKRSKQKKASSKLGFRILALAVVGALSSSYFKDQQQIRTDSASRNSSFFKKLTPPRFECDGRQHCTQMTSRAEAEFFIKNCPNTKMDGDHDGIPCENDSRF